MPFDLTLKVTPAGGDLYSLSRFNLQTDRDTTPADGAADTISNAALQSFSEAGMFERTASYYRFIVDSDGATTTGSPYPRCELRDETEYTQDQVTEYKVAAQVIALPDGEDTIIMQILDNDNGTSSAAVKVEVKGRAPLANNAWLRFKYDPTFGGAETAFNLLDNIAVDGSGGFVIPPIRIRRGPDLLEVYFGANVDGATPDWSAGDNTPIEGNPTSAFSRTPGANFTYYWKSGNYFQNNQTSPAVQCTIDQIAGTWAAPLLVSGGQLTVSLTIENDITDKSAPHPIRLAVAVTAGAQTDNTVGSDGIIPHWKEMHCKVSWYAVGGDNNGYSFTAPTRVYSGNDIHTDGHKNAGFSYGLNPGHLCRLDGSYIILVEVEEMSSGFTGTATLAHTVTAEDAAYPGTNTVCIQATGSTFPAPEIPAGATVITADTVEAVLSAHWFGQASRKRLIFNGLDNFTWGGSNIGLYFGAGQAVPGLLMKSGGTPGKANIQLTGKNLYADDGGDLDKKIVFQGLRFWSTWSDLTDTSDPSPETTFLQVHQTDHAKNIVIDDCLFEGITSMLLIDEGFVSGNEFITVTDSVAQNMPYCVLGYHAQVALIGNRFRTALDAILDSTSFSGWGARLHADNIYISQNDFMRAQGYSPFGNEKFAQEALRLNTGFSAGGNTNGYRYTSVCNVVDGISRAMIVGNQQTHADVPVNFYSAMNWYRGHHQVISNVQVGAGGSFFFSDVFDTVDVQGRSTGGGDYESFLDLNSNNGHGAGNAAAEVGLISCSCISDFDTSKNVYGKLTGGSIIRNFSSFTNPIEDNILEYQDQCTPAITADGPLQTLVDDPNLPTFDVIYTGYKANGVDRKSVTAPIPANTLLPSPKTGSPAIGSASSGNVAPLTFTGAWRRDIMAGLVRTTPSRGAVERAIES